MIRFIIVFVLLMFVAGCKGNVEKADIAFDSGDYSKAIGLYKQALDEGKLKAPEMAEIHFKMGKTHDKLSKPDAAVEEYRMAVELKPEELKYYMFMADDLETLGMNEEEVNVLRNVLILDGKNPHAESMLGNAYARLGQYMNALEEFRNALDHNPRDSQNYNNLGLVYDSLKQPDKAVSIMEAGLKINPNDEIMLQNLGAIYNRLKKYSDSARVYARLVQLKPDMPKFHNQLGAAYYNNAQYKQSYDEFKTVMRLDSNFPGIKDSVRLAERGKTMRSTGAHPGR